MDLYSVKPDPLMALTIAQFAALFLFNTVAGVFTGLVVMVLLHGYGGMKPLIRRVTDLESDVEASNGRFLRHQKRMAGEASADARGKMPKDVEKLLAQAAPREEANIEFVG